MKKLKKSIFCVLGMTFIIVSSASAQEVSSLIDHVKRLEKQVITLERQVYQGGTSAVQTAASSASSIPSSAASVFHKPGGGNNLSSSQVQTLEQEVQRVTGMIEDLTYKVNLQQKEQEAFKKDMEFRISEIEKKGALSSKKPQEKILKEEPAELEDAVIEKKKDTSTALSKGSKNIDGGASIGSVSSDVEVDLEMPSTKPERKIASSEALPGKEVAEQYSTGMELLKEKEYAASRKAFEGFIQNHPEDSLAGQAQYWLGEGYLAEGDYKKASITFLKAYRDYPENAKRPDSLLKLAESLNKLQKKKEACATLEKLLTDFPSANLSSLAKRNKGEWGC